MTRANRSRPSSLKGALRWGTRTSWVGVGAWQLHTRPGGPPGSTPLSTTRPAPTSLGSTPVSSSTGTWRGPIGSAVRDGGDVAGLRVAGFRGSGLRHRDLVGAGGRGGLGAALVAVV